MKGRRSSLLQTYHHAGAMITMWYVFKSIPDNIASHNPNIANLSPSSGPVYTISRPLFGFLCSSIPSSTRSCMPTTPWPASVWIPRAKSTWRACRSLSFSWAPHSPSATCLCPHVCVPQARSLPSPSTSPTSARWPTYFWTLRGGRTAVQKRPKRLSKWGNWEESMQGTLGRGIELTIHKVFWKSYWSTCLSAFVMYLEPIYTRHHIKFVQWPTYTRYLRI